MNLPNLLTLSRIGLTGAVMICLFSPGVAAKVLALGCFAVACATDWLDGRLARARRQATPFGALMDPIADKVLVLSVFLAFVQLGLLPAWMVVLIITRELLITGLRLLAISSGRVLPALSFGKHKTFWQMCTIVTILLLLILRDAAPRWLPGAAADVQFWTAAISYGAGLFTVGMTLLSGAQFLWVHRDLLRHG